MYEPDVTGLGAARPDATVVTFSERRVAGAEASAPLHARRHASLGGALTSSALEAVRSPQCWAWPL